MHDIQWRHLIDNAISSVMIPSGYSLTLYDNDGFLDSIKLVLDGYPWSDADEEMECINLSDHDWDDRATSVGVYRTNLGAFAQGRW